MFDIGFIYKDDRLISHRSYIKIFLNPLLRRFFGKAIGSLIENNEFKRYRIINQTEPKTFSFKIDFDYDYISNRVMKKDNK